MGGSCDSRGGRQHDKRNSTDPATKVWSWGTSSSPSTDTTIMASPGEPIVISDRAVVVAQIFYGVTIPLLVLATATLGYRLSKIKSRRNPWSDGCITVGYVSAPCTFPVSLGFPQGRTVTNWSRFSPSPRSASSSPRPS